MINLTAEQKQQADDCYKASKILADVGFGASVVEFITISPEDDAAGIRISQRKIEETDDAGN